MLEASTNVLKIFNVSATMARQGGRVQLEQSDMRLALNMATMAKEGFSSTTIEEMKYLIKKPHGDVREEMMRGVQCPWYKKVNAGIKRHSAMLCHNQTSACLPFQNVTTKYPKTRWRRKGTGAPRRIRHRVRTAVPTPPRPGSPSSPTGITSGAQLSELVNMPAGYTYSHTALRCAEFFKYDQDTEYDTDFDPVMLTDDC